MGIPKLSLSSRKLHKPVNTVSTLLKSEPVFRYSNFAPYNKHGTSCLRVSLLAGTLLIVVFIQKCVLNYVHTCFAEKCLLC